MAKKLKNPCWCGKAFATSKGLTQHKTKADHWQSPEEKREAEQRRLRIAEEMKTETKTYIGEEVHQLENGRHLKVGDKIRFERFAVIKEITYTGNENKTVSVRVDLITKTYEHIPHTK